MKNRLQIRYHIPETLPTRAQAMTYLQEAFAIGRTNSTNASLPAEPLVILYNDTQLDIANGITEAKRLETSNVLLAIGRGGDGVNVFNNQDYFVIDFAKHDEEIKDLTDTVDNILEVIEEVKENIEQMKADIKKNSDDIAAIIKKIGEKGDQCEKDTVYGYIQCAHDGIEDLNERLGDEIDDRKQADEDLQTHINMEADARAQEDERLSNRIIANQTAIRDEESAREESDQRIEDKFDIEVGLLKAKDAELESAINEEKDEREKADVIHTSDIAQQRSDFEEEKKFTRDKFRQIDNDITVLQQKDIAIDNEISNLKDKDREHDTAIGVNKTNIELLQTEVDLNKKEIAKNKVKSTRQTILVTPPTENGTNIEVNVDNKTIVIDEVGILSVDSSALVQYKGENAINVSDVVGQSKTISLKVNERDRIITNDDQGLLATLSLKWNHADATGEKDEIQLIGKDGIVISRIDVAEFIKDGFLDTVRLDTTDKNNPILIFTFNSSAGKETINIPVRDLVDIYLAGNGLQLNEHTFSIKLDNSSEGFLTISADGIKLSGVQSAINTAKESIDETINNKIGEVNTKIDNLQSTIRFEFAAADDVVRGEFAASDNVVRSEFKESDDALRTDFANADNVVRKEFADADSLLEGRIKNLENNSNNFAEADDDVKELIRTEFANADNEVIKAFTESDNRLEGRIIILETDKDKYKESDDVVRKEFADADTLIKTDLESKIGSNKSDIENIKNDYLKSSDKNDIVNQFTVADSDLSTRIGNNEKNIIVLNSGTSVDGSIKHSIYDSVIGQVVNTVTIDDASNQSLIKKFTVDDVPYIYTSNSSSDMKHNGTTLSYFIDELRDDVNDVTTLANDNKSDIAELRETINELKALITSLQTELNALKSNAITEVLGTDNEISAVKDGNKVTVKFADNAYFVAGE